MASNPILQLDLPVEADGRKVATLFIQEMACQGVHCPLAFKETLAHGEAEIEETAYAAREALRVKKRGLKTPRSIAFW